jgi:hypothetical protein
MSTGIGDLVATVSANTAPFQSAMSAAGKKVIEFTEKISLIGAPLRHMASVLEETAGQLLNLVNPVEWLSKGFNLLMYPLQWCARQFEGIMDAGKAIESFTRLENATVRLGAAMKNAGGDIGVTQAKIQEMTKGRAGGLEGMTTLVESGLKGGNLEAAYGSAKDLAAMMGTDMPTAANMLGTALEFPERAARMLREAHIKLTESQQEAIKTLAAVGNEAGAQAIILAAVQEKTEGVADAMRGTLGGQMKEFSGTIDHLSEIFGEALKPTMEAVVGLFKDMAKWVGDNKAAILAYGDTAGTVFRSITEPLETFISLLKSGETSSAMLYFQLQWEKLKDTITNIIAYIKAQMSAVIGSLGDQLTTIFKPLLESLDGAIDAAHQTIKDIEVKAGLNVEHHWFVLDDKLNPITKSNLGASIGTRSDQDKQAAAQAIADAAAQLINPSGSAATRAAQAAYNKSTGAQGIGLQTGVDLENKMAKEASDAFAKASVKEQATAAQAFAAELADWKTSPVNTAIMEKEKEVKEAKEEKMANGPNALEKGSAAAWTGIQDAINALHANGPAVETAENTKKIADWCDNNPPGVQPGPITESDLNTQMA